MKTIKNCTDCASAVWCATWAEVKCLAHKRRYSEPVNDCVDFEKRSANWKRRKCQCEDCLKNDALAEEYLEEK